MSNLSPYRQMRIILMYDLPTIQKSETKIAQKFHRYLLNQGYIMLQFSIYMKLCQNYDSARIQVQKIKKHVPIKGNIRLLTITEKQYLKMELLIGEQSLAEKYAKSRYIIEL